MDRTSLDWLACGFARFCSYRYSAAELLDMHLLTKVTACLLELRDAALINLCDPRYILMICVTLGDAS